MSADPAVYLDSSAIVKLVVTEPQSDAMRRALRRRPNVVSSELARVEVVRAVLAHGEPAIQRAFDVLDRITLLRMTDQVLDRAARLQPGSVRSLDAVHLASAAELGDEIGELITYDHRMATAARDLGLNVMAPE